MQDPLANAMARSERILSEKLELLYRNSIAIVVNFAVSCVAAWLLSDVYPHRVLAAWLVAVAAVCTARLVLQRQFRRAPAHKRCTPCAARRFALGALAAGLLWGAICLGLPVWGDNMDFILMAATCAGMTAGAVATISVHYPAYLCYTFGFAVPLTAVSITNPDPDVAGTGAMMVIYFIAITLAAWRSNRFIVKTVELRVDNEILKTSLDTARQERDAARTDKWSTLAQLSHELRTPLNAILGFSEAMQGEIFGSLGHPRYKEYADHVLSSGRDLLTLAEELLLLSQGEAGTLTLQESHIDVAATVRMLIDLKSAAAAKAGLALKAEIASGLPLLQCDRGKLRQMLLNLADNAIKFTPAGGTVRVAAAVREGAVEFTVSDTGIGMTAEQILLALEPFGRAATPLSNNTAGAGLGLPICRRLAELHGARLTLHSTPGEGTVCTLSFPAARTVTAASAAAA